MRDLLYKLVGWVWQAASVILPVDDEVVIIATFPDFDDTARAVSDALADSRYRSVFLVSKNTPIPDWISHGVGRVLSKKSLRGMFAFHRAKWVVVTHGLYSDLPKTSRQLIINLWHGMPIKKIGAMLGNEKLPNTDIVVAENTEYQQIMCETLGVQPEQVLLAPHPRIDIMLNIDNASRERIFADKWVLLWLPTYRDGRIGQVRSDGDPEQSILRTIGGFRDFDRRLEELNAVCILKPHPMEDVSEIPLNQFNALEVWTDDDLKRRNLSLYQFIGLSDALITDISSVYFEYKRLERPMFCFFPDFEAYEASRGFVRPFRELIDLPILRTEAQLQNYVTASFAGKSRHEADVEKTQATRPAYAREVLRKCGMEL